MTSHLLLSTIAATLPVLFGPDGDSPDAPGFTGPVFADGEWWHVLALSGSGGRIGEVLCSRLFSWPVSGRAFPLSAVSLRLDVPLVAARVAGLCARALAAQPWVGAFLTEYEANRQTCIAAQLGISSDLDPGLPARLAALYLSLAPRIAALGGSRD